ncbi:MAG: hypothetical protein ACR2RB_20145 [Gammaproteobacteria bacterium]
MTVFRRFRIMTLLYVLLLVAGGAWLAGSRSTSWEKPLRVTLYPIAGDASEATRSYLQRLQPDFFVEIDEFFALHAARYGVALAQPVRISLGPEVKELPPAPPTGGNPLAVMLWSLNLRWFSNFAPEDDETYPMVRIFVVYYDPELSPQLTHSLGLRKGLVGVVNAFATRRMTGSNAVLIAHELLHTLGAADRYDPRTALPTYPAGYAEPDRSPLYPQRFAEIMGGRVPLAPDRAAIPRRLNRVVIGPLTAREIRWTR